MTSPSPRVKVSGQRVRRLLGTTWYRLCAGLDIPTIRRRQLRRFAASRRASAESLALAGGGSNAAETTLAIVVPMYAHAAFVETALESVARQTRLPDEVILVNDGSPDNTGDVARAACARWPAPLRARLRILDNSGNEGQSASLNRAIAAASSGLIMVLNDDDYLFYDAVELVQGLFHAHPRLAMVGSICVDFDDNAVLQIASRPPPVNGARGVPLTITYPSDALKFRHDNDLNITHSGCAFHKQAWTVVGGYALRRQARVVRSADRDFQLKTNVLFPVGVSRQLPWAFWRNNSSVDQHRLT